MTLHSWSTILLGLTDPEVQCSLVTNVDSHQGDPTPSCTEADTPPTVPRAHLSLGTPKSIKTSDRVGGTVFVPYVEGSTALDTAPSAPSVGIMSAVPTHSVRMTRLCCASQIPPVILPRENCVNSHASLPTVAPTTVYTEADRSFSMCDVSMFAPDTHVLETYNVVICKDENRKTINDYLIRKSLGKGSYSKVKLVEHLPTGLLYAMKIVSNRGRDKQKRLLAVEREVDVMQRIAHPHLVRLREVLTCDRAEKLYLVMQYVSGGSIAKRTPNWTLPPVPEDTLRKYTRQLLSALKYLHVSGIIHRDIKPDNILIDDNGNAFLSDFGVSAIYSGDEGVAGVEGTPAYMAPELCRGDLSVTGHLVDVWALGVSLFELLYGVLPFSGSSRLELNRCILEDPVEFPDEKKGFSISEGDITSSSEFKEMIRGMLQKDSDTRWGVRKILNCSWLESLRTVEALDDDFDVPSPTFSYGDYANGLVTFKSFRTLHRC